jgi:predicted secreted protein
MACYAGKDGALSIGGTNIAMLTAWNVTQSAETLECAYMGSTWKDFKAGLLSWEGSADANFTDDTATQAMNEVTVGSEVAVVFYPVNAGAMSFTGTAIVTSMDNNAALGDVQTVSLSLTGSGALVTDITV